MDYFNESEIIPNKYIGPFHLGMSEVDLYRVIPQSKKRKTSNSYSIHYGSYTIWVDIISKTIKQIGVSSGFEGSLLGNIKVNKTVKEIKSQHHIAVNSDYQLIIKSHPGVCLSTEPVINDLQPALDENAVITGIYVYEEKAHNK